MSVDATAIHYVARPGRTACGLRLSGVRWTTDRLPAATCKVCRNGALDLVAVRRPTRPYSKRTKTTPAKASSPSKHASPPRHDDVLELYRCPCGAMARDRGRTSSRRTTPRSSRASSS